MKFIWKCSEKINNNESHFSILTIIFCGRIIIHIKKTYFPLCIDKKVIHNSIAKIPIFIRIDNSKKLHYVKTTCFPRNHFCVLFHSIFITKIPSDVDKHFKLNKNCTMQRGKYVFFLKWIIILLKKINFRIEKWKILWKYSN